MLIFYPRLIVLVPIKADMLSCSSSKHFRSGLGCQHYPRAYSDTTGKQPRGSDVSSKSCREATFPEQKEVLQEQLKLSYPDQTMFSVSAVSNAAADPLRGLSHSTDPPQEPLLVLLSWILAPKGVFCILLVTGRYLRKARGVIHPSRGCWSCRNPSPHTCTNSGAKVRFSNQEAPVRGSLCC